MSEKLKHCPFCGGTAKHYHRADDSGWSNTDWVYCSGECGASTCLHETKEQAVAAWNTRADVEAAVKRALEGAGKYLDEMALQNGYTKTPRGRTAIYYARKVRALDPAQFIEGEK